MLKKFLFSIAMLLSAFTISTPALATDTHDPCAGREGADLEACEATVADIGSGTPVATSCRYFLGMVSWDCNTGFDGTVNENTLKTGTWTAVANVATDITVIAAYLVIGYVIYGGYLYVFSAGDPGKTMNGKKTLSRAFIGLAIVMSANIILNSIRVALGVNFVDNCVTSQCLAPGDIVTNAIHWVIGIAGAIATIFVVYGGISYTTSAGDPGKLKKAKDMILYALIGLAIVALAELITAFVSNIIRNANNGTGLTAIIIEKEDINA